MTGQSEAPQLCEGADGLGEARQSRAVGSVRVGSVRVAGGLQHQHFEAPHELPEGLDVGRVNDGFDIRNEERAQPAGRDDRFPQRLPEGPLSQLFLSEIKQNFG